MRNSESVLGQPRLARNRTIEMHENFIPRIANNVLEFGNGSIHSNATLSTIFQNYLGRVDIRRKAERMFQLSVPPYR